MIYKTVTEAAIAGLKACVSLSLVDGFEYGGFVVKSPEGGYRFSPPVTSSQEDMLDSTEALLSLVPALRGTEMIGRNADQVQAEVAKAGVVAGFHTHPCDPLVGDKVAKYNSFQDMMTMMDFGFQNSYMAVNCTGIVYCSYESLPPLFVVEGRFMIPPVSLGDVVGNVNG